MYPIYILVGNHEYQASPVKVKVLRYFFEHVVQPYFEANDLSELIDEDKWPELHACIKYPCEDRKDQESQLARLDDSDVHLIFKLFPGWKLVKVQELE